MRFSKCSIHISRSLALALPGPATPAIALAPSPSPAVAAAAAPSIALITVLHLDNEATPLNRVNKDIPALKERIAAPAADKVDHATKRRIVILRIDIKERNLANPLASRVIRDAAHIQHPKAGAVVALEAVAVDDVLVVVDAVGLGLVEAGLLGRLEAADVPDVGHGEAVGGGLDGVELVVFVVHDEEFLPFGVEDPALVRVGGAGVGGAGDDGRVLLVGDVVAVEGCG